MIGGIVALAAIRKTIARLGQFADMAVNGMGTATAQIAFAPGAGPVTLGSRKSCAGRRITMAGITTAAGYDFSNTINMKCLVDKDISITVAGRPDI